MDVFLRLVNRSTDLEKYTQKAKFVANSLKLSLKIPSNNMNQKVEKILNETYARKGKRAPFDLNLLKNKSIVIVFSGSSMEELEACVQYKKMAQLLSPAFQIYLTCSPSFFSVFNDSFPLIDFIPVQRYSDTLPFNATIDRMQVNLGWEFLNDSAKQAIGRSDLVYTYNEIAHFLNLNELHDNNIKFESILKWHADLSNNVISDARFHYKKIGVCLLRQDLNCYGIKPLNNSITDVLEKINNIELHDLSKYVYSLDDTLTRDISNSQEVINLSEICTIVSTMDLIITPDSGLSILAKILGKKILIVTNNSTDKNIGDWSFEFNSESLNYLDIDSLSLETFEKIIYSINNNDIQKKYFKSDLLIPQNTNQHKLLKASQF